MSDQSTSVERHHEPSEETYRDPVEYASPSLGSASPSLGSASPSVRSARPSAERANASGEPASASSPAASHEVEVSERGRKRGSGAGERGPASDDAWVGRILMGRYRLERRLAEGGMASVFAATHVRNGCPVAVKVLHREAAAHTEVFTRFANEGAAANRVGHPAVVRVLDDDRDEDGTAFLVMELLCGETLEARWKRRGGRLTVSEVACVLFELLEGLGAAHAKNVIHCDIKPANVFLTSDGRLKILDFGIARVGGTELSTGSQMPLGTPAFMPPEQAVGSLRDIDARSDLWAAGATAFTLLSGRHVHDGQTPVETMLLCASSPAPALAKVAPDVPQSFARIVDRALQSDKRERWPNARAMQAAIATAYRETFKRPLSRRVLADPQGAPIRQLDPTVTAALAPLRTVSSDGFAPAEIEDRPDTVCLPSVAQAVRPGAETASTLRSRTDCSPADRL